MIPRPPKADGVTTSIRFAVESNSQVMARALRPVVISGDTAGVLHARLQECGEEVTVILGVDGIIRDQTDTTCDFSFDIGTDLLNIELVLQVLGKGELAGLASYPTYDSDEDLTVIVRYSADSYRAVVFTKQPGASWSTAAGTADLNSSTLIRNPVAYKELHDDLTEGYIFECELASGLYAGKINLCFKGFTADPSVGFVDAPLNFSHLTGARESADPSADGFGLVEGNPDSGNADISQSVVWFVTGNLRCQVATAFYPAAHPVTFGAAAMLSLDSTGNIQIIIKNFADLVEEAENTEGGGNFSEYCDSDDMCQITTVELREGPDETVLATLASGDSVTIDTTQILRFLSFQADSTPTPSTVSSTCVVCDTDPSFATAKEIQCEDGADNFASAFSQMFADSRGVRAECGQGGANPFNLAAKVRWNLTDGTYIDSGTTYQLIMTLQNP